MFLDKLSNHSSNGNDADNEDDIDYQGLPMQQNSVFNNREAFQVKNQNTAIVA